MLRSMDSIFTNGDIHRKLLCNIKNFIDNRDKYSKLNCPYKYSAILAGVPGAGKTSTILAIASELKRNINYINLSTTTMKDILEVMNTDVNRTIFVFEDIDAIHTNSSSNRDDDKTETNQMCVIHDSKSLNIMSLSLSDLLNITDGLLSSDGAICLFTTNHIEKLDSAFLRKGRMDGIFTYEYMNGDTAEKMVKYHLGHSIGKMKDGIKPAELQESILLIMTNKDTEDCLKKYLA